MSSSIITTKIVATAVGALAGSALILGGMTGMFGSAAAAPASSTAGPPAATDFGAVPAPEGTILIGSGGSGSASGSEGGAAAQPATDRPAPDLPAGTPADPASPGTVEDPTVPPVLGSGPADGGPLTPAPSHAVCDHRGNPYAGAIVRDHRGETGPTVRDHRTPKPDRCASGGVTVG